VIKVAEELVEAVRGGQVLVAIAQVVLAELAGRVVSPTASLGNPVRADPAADRRRTATSCYRRLKNPLKSLAFLADCKIPDNVGGDCGTVTSLSPESLPAFGGLTSSASAEGQMEPLYVRPALLS
jgi:hypothetical protein